MSRHPPDYQPPGIEESLRRIERALEVPLAIASRHIEEQVGKAVDRHRRKEVKRREREEAQRRKEEEKRARRATGSLPIAIVLLVFSALFVGLAALDAEPPLLFVALGLALGGAHQLSRAAANRTLHADRPRATVALPEAPNALAPQWERDQHERLVRLDERLERLRAAMREGPAVLREIVKKPEETFDGIRRGYLTLAERERTVRQVLSPEEDGRLARDHESLTRRLDPETDPLTRKKLMDALAALESHRLERSGLETIASRLEAEQIRLLHSLDGLHAQMLRARSAAAEGHPPDAALRVTMERISEEVGAVAEALETLAVPERIR